MHYIEAVENYEGDDTSLFLAGGITGCPDWQREMITALQDTSLVIFNPRRARFPIGDKNAAQEQIEWEYRYLRRASMLSFWFPKESLCPIALYELGAWSMTVKPLFVGCDPAYQRRQDVEIQTALARYGVRVVTHLDELTQEILAFMKFSHLY